MSLSENNKLSRVPDDPLNRIALSCSGGGYRATGFHLGAMSYLNRLKYENKTLLERVVFISTVSGGTITGVVYALQTQKGTSFKDIYDFMLTKLSEVDLLKEALQMLNSDNKLSNVHKDKNLINAFAELYEKHFTGDATLGDLNDNKSHLENFVFNTTEFNNGLNFRFKKHVSENHYSGNYYLKIHKPLVDEIKLSDVIASSACFPGGFEPMRWPHDFRHDNSTNIDNNAQTQDPVGIMDGGIYDNQGIDSILNYKKKDKNGKEIEVPYFDLVIISDVASPNMTPYRPTAAKSKSWIRKLTVRKVRSFLNILSRLVDFSLLTIIALSIWSIFLNENSLTINNIAWSITVISSILFLFKQAFTFSIRSAISTILKPIKKQLGSYLYKQLSWIDINQLSIHRVEPLLANRINSLVTLLMDVFLKVVRRLNYENLYENNKYEFRRVSCLIRELTQVDYNNRRTRDKNMGKHSKEFLNNSILNGAYDLIVGNNIENVIEYTSNLATTLWFEESEKVNQMLPKLVASGQFTMCYNMVYYLEKIMYEPDSAFVELPEDKQTTLTTLYEQCKTDWEHFKSNPMFLYSQLDKKNK